jgi:pimeloyl-ACP methyl ester carboxylesterase
VLATLAARARPTVIVTVSVGAGPALLAAADPAVRDRVRAVLSLGGYASASELLRFFLTGEYAWDGIRGRVAHDPAVVRAFVEANAELVGRPAHETAELLERLSPERVAPAIRARLILVHGVDDPTIPYTESLRMAAARPQHTEVVLVHLLAHVEAGRERSAWTALSELGRLVLAVYALARAA